MSKEEIPPGWEEKLDKQGRTYWYDGYTKKATWTDPRDKKVAVSVLGMFSDPTGSPTGSVRGLKELALNINGLDLDDFVSDSTREDLEVLEHLENRYIKPPSWDNLPEPPSSTSSFNSVERPRSRSVSSTVSSANSSLSSDDLRREDQSTSHKEKKERREKKEKSEKKDKKEKNEKKEKSEKSEKNEKKKKKKRRNQKII